MSVLEQGVKLLSTELRCRRSSVSAVQSDEVDLTCDEIGKAGGIPVVVELCSEGVLEFVRAEGQSRESVEVLLIAIGKKEGQNPNHVEVDDQGSRRTPDYPTS